jgi:O-antigen ligase
VTSFGAWTSAQARRFPASTSIDAPILLDIAALVAFPIVRTLANRSEGTDVLIGAWIVAVLVLAIRWPGSGLGLAAAVMVFPQPIRLGLAPSIAIIAACSVGFALDLALRGQPNGAMRRRLAIVVAGVIGLAAATLVALYRSLLRLDPEIAVEAARRWIEFGAGLAFFLMLLRAYSMGSKRPLIVGFIGISASLAVALIDFVSPTFLRSVHLSWLTPGESSRATGPFISPNRLGTVAGVVAIVGACQALFTRNRRWLWAVLMALGAAALIASFSRGALLGLVVAGAVVLALRSRRVAARYVVAVGIVAIVAVPLFVWARLAGSGGSLDMLLANDQGRFDAWLAGVRMILAEPIFGHGFYAFRVLGESFGATDGLQTAHNEFIGLWAESGVVAFAAFIVAAAGIVGCALERRSDPWALVAIGALTLFLVATCFNLQSIYLAVVGPVWLVIAYGIARPLAPAPVGSSDDRET